MEGRGMRLTVNHITHARGTIGVASFSLSIGSAHATSLLILSFVCSFASTLLFFARVRVRSTDCL